MAPRRRVFVSYHHHGDAAYYESFVQVFATTYDIVQDNSVERRIESGDSEYVIRRIRENYLTGSSMTMVLCGRNTPGRKFVDWEILASLNQEMGLLAINLPTNPPLADGRFLVPSRLHDNVVSGYATFTHWDQLMVNPGLLSSYIESALLRDKNLIVNNRPSKQQDDPPR